MLCFAQLPLIVGSAAKLLESADLPGLAGKNNVISFFTGIPYESLNRASDCERT